MLYRRLSFSGLDDLRYERCVPEGIEVASWCIGKCKTLLEQLDQAIDRSYKEYHNVNRTYSDVAQTLSHNHSFALRTDVYTYESGHSCLLLHIQGTLPVAFRGTTYAFPISLWVPQEYPSAAPISFVTPTNDMIVRPGQYVGGEGRIYHPYLAGWREDRSNLPEFCSILQNIFAREPPVVARQEQRPRPQLSTPQDIVPPPVPPLPPELGRSEQTTGANHRPKSQEPPPPPPKSFEIGRQTNQLNDQPPPLPPHPDRSDSQHGSRRLRENGYAQSPQPRPTQPPQQLKSISYDNTARSTSSYGQQASHQQSQYEPVSPVDDVAEARRPHHFPPNMQGMNHDQWLALPQVEQKLIMNRITYHDSLRQLPHRPVYQSPLQQPYHQPYPQQPIPNPPKPKPPEDLLTSPFENTIPVQAANIAPPPIPPNPQKDALLSALSQTLTQQIQSAHNSNISALPPLRAQQAALTSTLNAINTEMSQLKDLDTLLSSNEAILHKAMRDADKVLEDAKRREVPNVDQVLVAPTVVAGQLYQLVAEERSIEESRGVLGKALDKGRIGGGVWARQTRSLAREEFLKKALIKKISVGMGLVEDQRW